MVFFMARGSSLGLMAPSIRASSEIMKSQALVAMIGLIAAFMKVKFLTVSDMAKELTLTQKKVLCTRVSGKTDLDTDMEF